MRHRCLEFNKKEVFIWSLLVNMVNTTPSVGTITPACVRLSRTWTDLSVLRMIDSPRGFFDPELEQHKFVAERQEQNKNPVSTRRSVHQNQCFPHIHLFVAARHNINIIRHILIFYLWSCASCSVTQTAQQ